jgi:hypothetical protein
METLHSFRNFTFEHHPESPVRPDHYPFTILSNSTKSSVSVSIPRASPFPAILVSDSME